MAAIATKCLFIESMRHRRTVLLEKGRTEREGGNGFPRRLFAFSQGRSLLPSGHTRGVKNPDSNRRRKREKEEGGGAGGEGSSEDLPPRYETPEDQFRDTDTTTKNMETPL